MGISINIPYLSIQYFFSSDFLVVIQSRRTTDEPPPRSWPPGDGKSSCEGIAAALKAKGWGMDELVTAMFFSFFSDFP